MHVVKFLKLPFQIIKDFSNQLSGTSRVKAMRRLLITEQAFMNAKILVIGNEILDGDVQDLNSHWLSEKITGLGGIIKEITILRDDLDVIRKEVIFSIKDQVSLLVITGGLGPTIDDCTLEAVAQGTNRPIFQNKDAVEIVRSKYEELYRDGFVKSSELTDARLKMGLVPLGSE